MSLLTREELDTLSGAEELFPSPIPVQFVSSDEFMPSPQSPPRVAAYMLGIMIAGMGADHVVWGTDALWTGSPQWQIEALRRMEIPDDIQRKYGLAPMGPADGPVKRAILGENNARLYGYSPKMRASLATDRVAYCRGLYEKHGGDRTNLAYGYINKG